MQVAHIRTGGLRCSECTDLVEKTVSHADGVVHVVSILSLGLTSVMFDESLVDSQSLTTAIRDVGFDAELLH